jgi:hypothetical protein
MGRERAVREMVHVEFTPGEHAKALFPEGFISGADSQ